VEEIILVLRLGLVALLYLFLVQVLLVVWRDLRGAAPAAAGAAPQSARLVLVEPGGSGLASGTEFTLADSASLGRLEPNTVILPDPAVSARHARLSLRQGRWWVEDLGSANGTYVNGLPVEGPAPLADGSEIEIAQVRLRLEVG
jgi:pSer/pThr/pTyr-binding forkhead associated (FHA) protein